MTTPWLPSHVTTLFPLLALVGAALCVLFAEVWKTPWRFSAWIALTGMVVAVALNLIVVLSGQSGTVQGMLQVNGTTTLFAMLFCGSGSIVVLLELGSVRVEGGARYALVLFAICGATVVAQSIDLLPLILGLTIVHVALSTLIAPPAAWRHFVVQAIGLASVLLGTAFLYGATGSSRLDMLAARLGQQASAGVANPLSMLGLALVIGGLCIPLSIVPFHLPFAGTIRRMRLRDGCIVSILLPQVAIAALACFAWAWPPQARELMVLLAGVSTLYGYARALCGSQVSDVLAGIVTAQSSALLLQSVFVPTEGWTWLFYALGNYGLNGACLWAAAINARRADDHPLRLDDITGLGQRRPWLAGATTVCLLSLACTPPLIGAVSQLRLFRSAAAEGYAWAVGLAIAGHLMAWLTAGRWMLTMWMHSTGTREWEPTTPEVAIVALAAAGGMLLAGLYAEGILGWIGFLAAGS